MVLLSFLVSIMISALHLGIMLVLAPFVMLLVKWLEASMQGGAAADFHTGWREIRFGIYGPLKRFLFKDPLEQSVLLLIPLGMVIGAALMVPLFTTGNIFSGNADFFLIVSLLVSVSFFLFVAVHHDRSLLVSKPLQRMVIELGLYFPMLFFMAAMLKLGTGSAELNQVVLFFHHSGFFMTIALCSLLIGGFSLLFLVLDIPDLSERIRQDGFTQEKRAVMVYVNDLQFLVWLSLIAFLFWPQSVALFDLRQGSFESWLVAAFFGFLAWVVKILLECVAVALMRNLLSVSSGTYRVGVATILNFLAVIIYFVGMDGI